MSTLGVVAALPAEGRALSGQLQATGTINTSIPDLLISICGVGQTAADRAARDLVARGAGALVSWGCGAGLTSGSYPGQLFLPQTIVDPDGKQSHAVDTAWHARLVRILQDAGPAFETTALVSVNSIVTGNNVKQQLHHVTGAGIADMESAAVAAVAAEHHRPFLCVRAVADNLTIMLPPEILPLLDDFGRPRTIAMLSMLLRRPALIPQLIKLGQAFRQARQSLAAVARASDRKLAFSP